jgi:hypothetical protein
MGKTIAEYEYKFIEILCSTVFAKQDDFAKCKNVNCKGEGEWITLLDSAGHPFCFVIWS